MDPTDALYCNPFKYVQNEEGSWEEEAIELDASKTIRFYLLIKLAMGRIVIQPEHSYCMTFKVSLVCLMKLDIHESDIRRFDGYADIRTQEEIGRQSR